MIRTQVIANPPASRTWIAMLCAFGLAMLIMAIVFAAYGVNPIEAFVTTIQGTLLNPIGLLSIVRWAIPLLLIGAGLALALKGQFFNIGAEGQLLIGATAATGVALFVPLPAPLLIPAMFVAGFVAGGLYAFLAAFLRTRFNVNEILSTLMLNYIAIYVVLFLINGPWRGKLVFGYPRTDELPEAARLPLIAGTNIHWITLLLGLIAAVLLYVLLTRSTTGYELRVVGENPNAARYAGINIGKSVLLVALISGGLAGLAGVGEVAGIHGRLLEPQSVSAGMGFTAVIVAWLARGNPVYAIFSALFMAALFAGADEMKTAFQMPGRVKDVLSGLLLMLLIASDYFVYHRIIWGKGGKK